ncbi:MAG TPA: MarR family transcriptional regulator [Candidatus Dormibacteraeota bacterium]
MTVSRDDVRSMVTALFVINAGLERARREKKPASALNLLQVIAVGEAVRPSEIAARQHVHQSLVTRQIREMEAAGYVKVTANPADGRSCLVTLTRSGRKEMDRLTEIGLQRFALFVKDWRSQEIRAFTESLEKLQESMLATADEERGPRGRRWATS